MIGTVRLKNGLERAPFWVSVEFPNGVCVRIGDHHLAAKIKPHGEAAFPRPYQCQISDLRSWIGNDRSLTAVAPTKTQNGVSFGLPDDRKIFVERASKAAINIDLAAWAHTHLGLGYEPLP